MLVCTVSIGTAANLLLDNVRYLCILKDDGSSSFTARFVSLLGGRLDHLGTGRGPGCVGCKVTACNFH